MVWLIDERGSLHELSLKVRLLLQLSSANIAARNARHFSSHTCAAGHFHVGVDVSSQGWHCSWFRYVFRFLTNRDCENVMNQVGCAEAPFSGITRILASYGQRKPQRDSSASQWCVQLSSQTHTQLISPPPPSPTSLAHTVSDVTISFTCDGEFVTFLFRVCAPYHIICKSKIL